MYSEPDAAEYKILLPLKFRFFFYKILDYFAFMNVVRR